MITNDPVINLFTSQFCLVEMPILGRISVEESLLRVMKLFLLAFSSNYHVNTVINSISTNNHKQKFSASFLNGKKKCDSLLFLGRIFTVISHATSKNYHWNKKKLKTNYWVIYLS